MYGLKITYLVYNVWDEIAYMYPFPNFNGCTVSNLFILYWACDDLSMFGLKLNHVCKRGPGTLLTDTSLTNINSRAWITWYQFQFSSFLYAKEATWDSTHYGMLKRALEAVVIWVTPQTQISRKLITVTSWWTQWRLKSLASQLFDQPFFRRISKQTSKLRVTGLCKGD